MPPDAILRPLGLAQWS